MRFPDVLVELNKLHERLRMVEFDLRMMKRDFIRVLPDAAAYFTDVSDEDRPKWTEPNPEVINAATKARKAGKDVVQTAEAELAVGDD